MKIDGVTHVWMRAPGVNGRYVHLYGRFDSGWRSLCDQSRSPGPMPTFRDPACETCLNVAMSLGAPVYVPPPTPPGVIIEQLQDAIDQAVENGLEPQTIITIVEERLTR